MKKICALSLALSLLIALAAPVYAGTSISSAYVYEEGGMPKYWLDFTGSVADNVVLHCFFQTDSCSSVFDDYYFSRSSGFTKVNLSYSPSYPQTPIRGELVTGSIISCSCSSTQAAQ